jgi:hypothetical protein
MVLRALAWKCCSTDSRQRRDVMSWDDMYCSVHGMRPICALRSLQVLHDTNKQRNEQRNKQRNKRTNKILVCTLLGASMRPPCVVHAIYNCEWSTRTLSPLLVKAYKMPTHLQGLSRADQQPPSQRQPALPHACVPTRLLIQVTHASTVH